MQMLSVTAKTSLNEVTANDLIREFPQVFNRNIREMKGEKFKGYDTAPRTIP